jgi:hypothetical protein
MLLAWGRTGFYIGIWWEKPLGTSRHREEDDIKMDLREMG